MSEFGRVLPSWFFFDDLHVSAQGPIYLIICLKMKTRGNSKTNHVNYMWLFVHCSRRVSTYNWSWAHLCCFYTAAHLFEEQARNKRWEHSVTSRCSQIIKKKSSSHDVMIIGALYCYSRNTFKLLPCTFTLQGCTMFELVLVRSFTLSQMSNISTQLNTL